MDLSEFSRLEDKANVITSQQRSLAFIQLVEFDTGDEYLAACDLVKPGCALQQRGLPGS